MDSLEFKSSYSFGVPQRSSERLNLLSAYDLSITHGPVQIEIGRFSYAAIRALRIYSKPAGDLGEPVVTIGAFCNFSISSQILVGGEHLNDNLFNVTLGEAGSFYRSFMPIEGRHLVAAAPARGVQIGNGVVCSTGSAVLDGSRVGDGCLVAANALVSGRAESFGVYVGSPAKLLRDRLSPRDQIKHGHLDMLNIAAHAVPNLPSTALEYQQGLIPHEEMRQRLPLLASRPKLHATITLKDDASIGSFSINSFSVGSKPVTDEAANARLHKYFSQIKSPDDNVQWVPDVFLAMGLTGLRS